MEAFMDHLASDPAVLARLEAQNPQLARALKSRDAAGVRDMLRRVEEHRRQELKRKQQELALLQADPFDAEAQKRIASMIQQQNVNENMESAMENSPELFGNVVMLYVNMEVNGRPLKGESSVEEEVQSVRRP